MAAPISISMLGPLRVECEGAPVSFNGVRLQTLVAMLALVPGREVPRPDLVEAVWGERIPAAPGNSLQALISRLRRVAPLLPVDSFPTGYRLSIDPEWVDTVRFETMVRRARDTTDPRRRSEVLREALGLWRGSALPGLSDAPVLRAHAARLDELRRTAIEERIAADLALGIGPQLIPELEGLVEEHPLRETFRLHLMQALRAAGRYADALFCYEQGRVELARQLGVDPSPSLRAAHLALLAEGADQAPAPPPAKAPREDTPPPREDTPPVTRLPLPLTGLIGRDADVGRLRRLVASHRLVTIVGPGGAGKTRLAVEVAHALARAGDSPVWLVQFGGLTEAEDVSRAILDATSAGDGGLLFDPGPPAARPQVWQRLVSVLSHNRPVLVLDTCEHLLPEVARTIEALLGSCPGLRILATSRQSLGVAGETLHPLEGLAVPAAGEPATAEHAAVRLFLERGRGVRPTFRLDDESAEHLAVICRALDGLPLALELAAARLRTFSVAQLATRLRDRLDVLFAGGEAPAERQRTLRAVIDWSWQLLTDRERELAARLSVFAQPVEMAALVETCADDEPGGIRPGEVERLVTALVDKSLVQADTEADPPRLRMLDTVRVFARERLSESGKRDAVWLRHGHALLRLAERNEPRMRRGDQARAVAELVARTDDISAVLHWSLRHAPPALPIRLVAALEWFWLLSGRRAEGIAWTDRVLALDGTAVPAARAMLCAVGGLQHGALLGSRTGVAYLMEAFELIERLPADQPRHPVLLLLDSLRPMLDGDPDRMIDVLRAHRDDGDPWVRAQTRMLTGRLLMNAGRPEPARADLMASLGHFRGIGERLGQAQALGGLAELDTAHGDHAAAGGHLTEALRVAGQLGVAEDNAMLRVRLGAVLAREGQVGPARRELETALGEARRLGLGETAGAAHHVLGDLARWEGRHADARELLDLALAEVQEHGRGVGLMPAVLASQGHLAVRERRLRDATELCRDTFRLTQEVGDAQALSRVAVLAADIALARADVAHSATLVAAAEAARGLPIGADPDEVRVAGAVRHERAGRSLPARESVPALESLLGPLLSGA